MLLNENPNNEYGWSDHRAELGVWTVQASFDRTLKSVEGYGQI
jgi:hypothetical protein